MAGSLAHPASPGFYPVGDVLLVVVRAWGYERESVWDSGDLGGGVEV